MMKQLNVSFERFFFIYKSMFVWCQNHVAKYRTVVLPRLEVTFLEFLGTVHSEFL